MRGPSPVILPGSSPQAQPTILVDSDEEPVLDTDLPPQEAAVGSPQAWSKVRTIYQSLALEIWSTYLLCSISKDSPRGGEVAYVATCAGIGLRDSERGD